MSFCFKHSLSILKNIFFQNKTTEILNNKNIEWTCLNTEKQNILLNQTVNHPVCEKFAPRKKQQIAYLKRIVQKLEEHEVEILDELYEKYTELLGMSEEDTDISYKTYFVDEHQCVTLQESINMISKGTTGLCTWQAGMCLAEWALDNKLLFNNKNILELGSGVGLTGLIISHFCNPKHYIFSDCHHEVLTCLQKNVMINQVYNSNMTVEVDQEKLNKSDENHDLERNSSWELCQIENTKDVTFDETETCGRDNSINEQCLFDYEKCSECQSNGKQKTEHNSVHRVQIFKQSDSESHTSQLNTVEINRSKENHIPISSIDGVLNIVTEATNQHFNASILNLDWEDCEMEKLCRLGSNVDIIVAADVVYDDRIIPSLVRVLHILLSSKTTKERGSLAYIASTVRNEDTIASFKQALADGGIQYERIENSSSRIFLYDHTEYIMLLYVWV